MAGQPPGLYFSESSESEPRLSSGLAFRAFRLLFLACLLQIVEGDVVLADHLHELPVRLQLENALALPRLRVSFGSSMVIWTISVSCLGGVMCSITCN